MPLKCCEVFDFVLLSSYFNSAMAQKWNTNVTQPYPEPPTETPEGRFNVNKTSLVR